MLAVWLESLSLGSISFEGLSLEGMYVACEHVLVSMWLERSWPEMPLSCGGLKALPAVGSKQCTVSNTDAHCFASIGPSSLLCFLGGTVMRIIAKRK